ncbi:ABC transporter permease subunit [Polaromonas jejuensis]
MTDSQWARHMYLIKQGLIVAAVLGILACLAIAIRAGLARNGIGFDMGFLGGMANFDISEGSLPTLEGLRRFVSSDTNGQALLVGFLNTVKVSIIAIALSTVLGVLIGVARVSRNWLVRQLSFGLVEFVRNTPLLIQLVFWYFAVALKLPGLADASVWLGGIILSQQGLYLPTVVGANGAPIFAIWALLMSVVFLVGAVARKGSRTLKLAGAALGLVISVVLGFPLTLQVPQADGVNVVGGLSLTPEFGALVAGLSVYTAAFIAEIVRGAILSLPKGQWEASAALGLTRRATFVDIVVPQVFRVVLPAFGNQYISLAKSTSLGIAIGFSDLFNVYGTVANQSGRSLEGVIVVMLAYLFLSWIISAVVNLANSRVLKAGGSR